MNALYRLVLGKIAKGPIWARSLGPSQPIVRWLVDQGFVRRVRPAGGRARNMLEITAAGRAALRQPSPQPHARRA